MRNENANGIKVRRFFPANWTSFATALSLSSFEEQERHISAREYNEKDYLDKLKQTFKWATEILVIQGKLYYLTEMTGIEKGLTLLNRLETLGGCLHDAPFYKVQLETLERDEAEGTSTDRLTVDANSPAYGEEPQLVKFKRDTRSRKLYAQWEWIMTTEHEVATAALKGLTVSEFPS